MLPTCMLHVACCMEMDGNAGYECRYKGLGVILSSIQHKPVSEPNTSAFVTILELHAQQWMVRMTIAQAAVAEKDHELDTLRKALDEKRVCRPLPPPPQNQQQPPPPAPIVAPPTKQKHNRVVTTSPQNEHIASNQFETSSNVCNSVLFSTAINYTWSRQQHGTKIRKQGIRHYQYDVSLILFILKIPLISVRITYFS